MSDWNLVPKLPASALPGYPVIVAHLEAPAGSGLAACCGLPLPRLRQGDGYHYWLCTGCHNAARTSGNNSTPVMTDTPGLDVERLARALPEAMRRQRWTLNIGYHTSWQAVAAAVAAAYRNEGVSDER